MIVDNSPHFKAFIKLKPIPTDAEDAAVALELDRVLAIYNEDYKEIFPTTAVKKINDWENLYELPHDGELEARRQALLAAINKDSGIAERHYIALAASLGFAIQITKPPRMLRAGLGRAGFPAYEPDMQYTWTVSCNSSEEDADMLIRVLEEQKIPFTRINWDFTVGGSSNTLLRIAEAEVSMLTIDGSDGKGNEFILNAVSDDGQPMRGIRWISLDTSIATVTSNGDGLTATVRGVGIGAASLGANVLIYASHNGVVKECLFTIYNTLPSADVDGAGLWAIKGGQGDGIEVYFRSYNVPIEPLTYVYMDYSAMYTQNVDQNSAFRPISSTSFNHPVIIYNGGALRFAKRIATVNGTSYRFSNYKTFYVITPSIETRNKILIDSKMFINDVQQNLQLVYTSDPQTTPNNAVIIFDGTQKKVVTAIASNASINMSDLTSPLMSYICQNYVKFTDYDSYVNRTKILNMGTLGHSCDMEANNVPETWFNI